MRPSAITVAIDGPAGSGKSSVARAVAEARGLAYLDTGAMYRALTAAVLRAGVDVQDAAAVARVAAAADLEVGTEPDDQLVRLDGHDVSDVIRGAEVTGAVSAVSAVPAVRELLLGRQRTAIAAAIRGIVVEGRDIGSVVAPDAAVKVFLVAHPEVRAVRRAAQDHERTGSSAPASTAATLVRGDLDRRDAADSNRTISPLRPASDAVTIDATDLDLEQVVAAVLDLVDRARS